VNHPIVVAITGASGAVYGLTLLDLLAELDVEVHLVVTDAAAEVLAVETDETLGSLSKRATKTWRPDELTAPVASGSFRTAGMIVAPCTIRTLSAVANSRSSNLVERAADVTLKERRPLVLMVREPPLHAGHLRLMQEATAAGAVVMPPVPAFYTRPQSIEELVRQTAARALDLLGLDHDLADRWG